MAVPAGADAALWTKLTRASAVMEKYVDKSFLNRNGNSAQVPEEIAMLRRAVEGKLDGVSSQLRIRNVCEIGFNAGHSAIVRARTPASRSLLPSGSPSY